MTTGTMTLPDIVACYDGFILDLWGVVHDGVRPYPGVIATLERLRAAEKRVMFLSNAPRRARAVAQALERMGIGEVLYDGIVTSGEVVRDALIARADADFAGLGGRLWHLGPERDRNLFDDLDLIEVARPSEADFLLNTGPNDLGTDGEAESYEDALREAFAAGIPMVCANPDLEIIRDGRRIVCAGLLAQHYAAWGGRVIWRGKPDSAVYEPTLAKLGTKRERTVAFGDSLRTDIAGAKAAGIDSVLVLSGVHVATPEAARADCTAAGLDPVAIIPGLIW